MEQYVATVKRIRRESDDIVTIYFTTDREFTYIAGQYITVFFPDSSTPAGKAYSLSSAPQEMWLSITVKKVGEYSGRLQALAAGDTFRISPAYGFFNPETTKPLVCITAGCGLAPIWSVVKHEFETDASRVAHIFYSNRHADSIPFHAELDELDTRHKSLRVTHHITQEPPRSPSMRAGRIDLDACVKAVEDDAIYLLCGSVDFVRDIWRGLTERGVSQQAISTETFFE